MKLLNEEQQKYKELEQQINALYNERIDLEIQLYQKLFPNENFITPNVKVAGNLEKEAKEMYRSFDYPEDYIKSLDDRASWKSTVALTIANKTMGMPPTIVISGQLWRDDTMLHELTHVNDYYGYAKRNDLLDMTYMDFLRIPYFQEIYLFSEFRAFYRGTMYSKKDLRTRIEYERKKFQERQEEAIEKQQLEAYYYHLVSFVAFYCAFLDKFSSQDETESLLSADDINSVHTLTKFLFPQRNKEFSELEKICEEFHALLDMFIDKTK